MQNLIPVNPLDNLTRIEYKGRPVLTTAQLAAALSTPKKNIPVNSLLHNFQRNRERYVEGKHFFLLEGAELENFKSIMTNCPDALRFTVRLMLWTRRGVLHHCKSVNTDVAWYVYEILEDTYFKVQEILKEKTQPTAADIELAEAMRKTACHSKDPYKREKLVAEAANLLFAREEFVVPEPPKHVEQLSLFYFK